MFRLLFSNCILILSTKNYWWLFRFEKEQSKLNLKKELNKLSLFNN